MQEYYAALLFGVYVLAYGLGSIPFGLVLTRAAGIGNLREIGSGNIGATNVMRTGKKSLALATFLLDGAKGAVAVIVARFIFNHDLALIAGLLAILGHIFPIWLQFKGGKGVATTIGVLLALNPALGGAVCLMWLVIFAFTRISSLAAMMSIGYSAFAAYVLDTYLTSLFCLCLAGLIIFTHRSNITRLLDGTEGKFRKDNRKGAA